MQRCEKHLLGKPDLLEQRQNFHQLVTDCQHGIWIYRNAIDWQVVIATSVQNTAVEFVACAADREALFVEQFAYAAYQQHFVMLIIPTVTASFDRLQLRKFLLPIAQDVWFDAAEFADFTDREVTFGWNWRQWRQFRFIDPFVHLSACVDKRFLAGRIDHAFEFLAGVESDYAACGDRNFFTGFWIAARTLRFVAQLEVTETR